MITKRHTRSQGRLKKMDKKTRAAAPVTRAPQPQLLEQSFHFFPFQRPIEIFPDDARAVFEERAVVRFVLVAIPATRVDSLMPIADRRWDVHHEDGDRAPDRVLEVMPRFVVLCVGRPGVSHVVRDDSPAAAFQAAPVVAEHDDVMPVVRGRLAFENEAEQSDEPTDDVIDDPPCELKDPVKPHVLA